MIKNVINLIKDESRAYKILCLINAFGIIFSIGIAIYVTSFVMTVFFSVMALMCLGCFVMEYFRLKLIKDGNQ